MFNIELKFACDILNKWFQYKIKPNKMSLSNLEQINYHRNNIVTTESKCCICKFRLDVMPRSSNLKQKNEMSYIDFLIANEHAFIRNIYDESDLKNSKNLCSFQNYYKVMVLYTHLVQVAENEIKTVISYEDIFDDKLRDFLTETCPAHSDCIEDGLVREIKAYDVKNTGKTKIPKFTLKIYAFIYDVLMDFPPCKFDEVKTVTARGFLSKFYKVVTSKVHIHHSHVTGEIHGYAHDFCNWQVRENNTMVSLIGHNFLGFDIFFMVKGFRASCWGTTELSMGRANLTNFNFANISSQVKIIDTLKYYQTTLANLSSTTDKTEKGKIKEGIQSFLEKHVYFCKAWDCLSKEDKDSILNMIAEGKGVMPYEKITDIHSLSKIVPEDDFFKHTEFYSSLKQSNISLEEYENVKFLCKKLQMRNVGDMNDLYNVQDVIILCEIIENRFEQMYQKFGFNPRKCNSASTLSGCIQRETSKVIITLPTNFEHAAIFEKNANRWI